MTYKYQKIVTVGANGTTIAHNNIEENSVFTLGDIEGYTYISALSLEGQPKDLTFIEVTLTESEKEELLSQKHMQTSKLNARNKIRKLKDIEDDLTDQKMLIQFMARGFAGLWTSLPNELKEDNPYKENFDAISSIILTTDVRLDLERDQLTRIISVIEDEANFAQIVEEDYKGKL